MNLNKKVIVHEISNNIKKEENKPNKINSIQLYNKDVEDGNVGDFIAFTLKQELKFEKIKRGMFITNDPNLKLSNENFLSKLVIVDKISNFDNNYSPFLNLYSGFNIPCFIVKTLSKIEIDSEKEIEKEPKLIKNGDCILVILKPKIPIIIENFDDNKNYGRIICTDSKKVIAGFFKIFFY
jgi:elongation factor 1-alpha